MTATISTDNIRQTLAELLEKDVDSVALDATLDDLVSDSFELVEIVIELQEIFDVQFHQEDLDHVRTVADVIRLTTDRAS